MQSDSVAYRLSAIICHLTAVFPIMIIPFFIPHAGCPHQCVFCNQRNITGQIAQADPPSVPNRIEEYLNTGTGRRPVHVAFYGGSFTALPAATQQDYLDAVRPFIVSGQVSGIRLSTRPDCITGEILTRLKDSHVDIVELGVQSMDDHVLALSGRGHTAEDSVKAVRLLKEYDLAVGLQLMPGLPGDTPDIFLNTVEDVIALKPDFVRLYPALVIRDTPLAELYKTGRYIPLHLDDAVSLCRSALLKFEQEDIEVIRIGLQPTEELERPGTIMAGPYHPAFRQLVESSLLLERMRALLKGRSEKDDTALIQVNPRDLSAAIGQHRSNVDTLKREFGLRNIRIAADEGDLKRRTPVLIPSC
ncbi:MAG TPA: radical SAM protein [Nitrospirota bacterium]